MVNRVCLDAVDIDFVHHGEVNPLLYRKVFYCRTFLRSGKKRRWVSGRNQIHLARLEPLEGMMERVKRSGGTRFISRKLTPVPRIDCREMPEYWKRQKPWIDRKVWSSHCNEIPYILSSFRFSSGKNIGERWLFDYQVAWHDVCGQVGVLFVWKRRLFVALISRTHHNS